MSTPPRYDISHVYLNRLDLVLPSSQQSGSYLIFWWQAIPLGHLWMPPNQLLSPEEYYQALLMAITPAINHYAPDGYVDRHQWPQWLAQGEHARWHAWMETLFSDARPAVLPQQVPITVIICTRNRTDSLQRCLTSLTSLVCQPAEILVVDNAPPDERTRELVASYPVVRYYVEPRPGLSHARNTGIEQATYEVLAFTDDDVLLHPDWAYRVWETFRDKQVFAMTGLVLVSELETEAQQLFEEHWSFNRGYRDIYYEPSFIRPASHVWQIGAGANSAFRKEVFRQVGYFDKRLGAGASGCSEDSEMWFRLLVHGYRVHYNPRAVVYHAHRRSLSALHEQLFSYMRGHVVAALIQHAYHPQARYTRYVFKDLPIYYAHLTKAGLPFFRTRSKTLWAEMRGLVSGLAFYYRYSRGNTRRHE
jgi:GT2 family glycosyltransferase